MSSRDWNAIGGNAPLPRWIRWAIPPLLIPLAGIAWLGFSWNRIPLRFGHPLVARTPLHVFGFVIFGEGLAILMVGMVLASWYGSGRPAKPSSMEKFPLAVAYLLSTVFTAVSLSQVGRIPAALIVVVAVLGSLSLLAYMLKTQTAADDSPDSTPDECWSLSGIYYNPKDPALFVRARVGYGYTFNMGNPWARKTMIGFISGVVLLVGFLIWSLH